VVRDHLIAVEGRRYYEKMETARKRENSLETSRSQNSRKKTKHTSLKGFKSYAKEVPDRPAEDTKSLPQEKKENRPLRMSLT